MKKAFVREPWGIHGSDVLVDYDTYKWTGRWKLITTGDLCDMYLECKNSFCFIPYTDWILDARIEFREEVIETVYECEKV